MHRNSHTVDETGACWLKAMPRLHRTKLLDLAEGFGLDPYDGRRLKLGQPVIVQIRIANKLLEARLAYEYKTEKSDAD